MTTIKREFRERQWRNFMSNQSEFNLNKEKCLSCQHYSGCHGISSGLMGDRIEYESSGLCDKRGSRYQENTTATRWCSKWTRDSRISQAIANKERKAAEQKMRQEQYQQHQEDEKRESELRAERRRIETARIALEEERKRLEYERWYSSLSPEEKEKEDCRIEEEKRLQEREAAERRIRYEQEQKEREEQRKIAAANAKKTKKKKLIIIFSLILAIVLLIVGINVGKGINNFIQEKKQIEAFNNSSTGIFTKYLSEQEGYKNGMYGVYLDVEGRGQIYISIEYQKNGFVDNYGRTCDFRVITYLLPKAENKYTEIDGYFFFNLGGSDNDTSFGTVYGKYGTTKESYPNFCANAKYGTGSVLIQYQSVAYSVEKGEPEPGHSYYQYSNWDKVYNECIDEWEESGWTACLSSYLFANELYKEATGTTLYK